MGSIVRATDGGERATYGLADRKVLPASGIVMLAYSVAGSPAAAPTIRYVKGARASRHR